MKNINRTLLSITLLLAAHSRAADSNNVENNIEYKFTSSYYNTNSGDAYDVNLRGNSGNQTAWLGEYQDYTGFKQARAGYEYQQEEDIARITWSAQIASRGFVGGSATAEVGGNTFALIGIGRTNLRNYYNLNFDPNDALTAGIGTRAIANTELSFFRVWDDRLNTRQQVTHGVIRYKPTSTQRISIDASYKSGLSNEGIYIDGYGVSVTYDYQHYFIRVAQDQHVNFTQENMMRFSAGIRF
jgi:hypothetical protein